LVVVIFTLLTTTSVTGNKVYGQANPKNLTNSGFPNVQEIPAKKVRVGDIDIAYKTLGRGDPILLISPAQADMNAWEPSTLGNFPQITQ
jgi:hypothetical protein